MKEGLLIRGYKEFKTSSFEKLADPITYQKRVTDKFGTKYFITIHSYSLMGYPTSYEANLCFMDKKDIAPTSWIKISMAGGLSSVEELAENFWVSYGKHYYSLYNE